MSLIKKLPQNLANKIAAGEVVERPASVVKELLENSIDAGADKIITVLEQSGKKLIQMVDNGSGMNADDIQAAFERHATSKIKTEADLDSIESLGFRGEALPSIASVAQIEIKARTADEKMGNIYTLNGGRDGKLKKTAANTGTSISVKNLFFNTPARQRFLKSDNAEYQQILIVLKRFFLAYPQIHFELWVNDKEIFKLQKGGLKERAQAVFGESTAKMLLSVTSSLGGIELSGFIGRPDAARKSRGQQFLFLNGRPIHNKSINHAVFQGYSNLIGPGEYPVYCLFLKMNPDLVDVNVHPAKMEVRFTNDRSLYYFFINSISRTLSEEGVIPALADTPSGSAVQNTVSFEERPKDIIKELQNRGRSMARQSGPQLSLTYFETADKSADDASGKESAHLDNSFTLPPQTELKPENVNVSFWQIHNRYILSEIKSGMVIIDQHVAHERILFEKISSVLKEGGDVYGQKLLFPQKLTLAYDDFLVFKEISEVLNKIGFSIKSFSGSTIVIEAMPADVKVGRESQIILDIIDYYRNEPLREFDHFEKIAAAYACKNAVKSGEALSQLEMQNLVDQLFACDSPFFCPHGRPVIVTIDLEELDRKFKRIP